MGSLLYQCLADSLLIIHTALVLFVIASLPLIVAGAIRNWAWVRNFYFRALHLLLIAAVAIQTWLKVDCPLTVWESRLREAAGGSGYEGSFIEYWLRRLLYYDFQPAVFMWAYTLYALVVLVTWLLVPPVLPPALQFLKTRRGLPGK